MKKFKKLKDQNLSDNQLAVLYEMEEKQIRMEIET